MPDTEGTKTILILKSMKITPWIKVTILKWRLFRDVFLERFILD